ncbi:MAG TPA: hypothetical protein VGJ20_45580 [Xanthobacteraceae bacterium]
MLPPTQLLFSLSRSNGTTEWLSNFTVHAKVARSAAYNYANAALDPAVGRLLGILAGMALLAISPGLIRWQLR